MKSLLVTRPSFNIDRYLQQRLVGGSGWRMACNMLSRSFTANTLSGFWRYWNPGYGYFLLLYCYQPLRRWFPHSVAVLLTFLACGFFLHDIFYLLPVLFRDGRVLFPLITAWFAIIATGLLATDQLGLHLRNWPNIAKVVFHLAYLGTTFCLARYLDPSRFV